MSLSIWQRSDKPAERTFDVAVVGGGMLGCSTAYWLRRLRPEWRVAILDANRLAYGASGRNAGFLLQGGAHDYLRDIEAYGQEKARALWHFTRESRERLASELDTRAIQLEASGSLTAAGSPEEAERLRESVSFMRADGAPVAFIPPDETNRRLSSRGFFGALYVPSGAMVDPVALVRRLADESAAAVFEGVAVEETGLSGGDVVLQTPGRTFRARQAVFCLNAYLPRLFPSLERYVRPVRAQMLATEPMLPRWLRSPVYSHDGYFYTRQNRDGTILVGGARHQHERDEVGFEDQVTRGVQSDLETYLHYHFPQTGKLAVQSRWTGTMGFSPDGLPSVGELDDVPGSFWAAGFTGHGMSYGFRFGLLLAELLTGKPNPESFHLFSAARFAAEPLPSPADSALKVDKALVRRVSREESRQAR